MNLDKTPDRVMASDYRYDDGDYDDDDDDRIPKGICSVGIPCACTP